MIINHNLSAMNANRMMNINSNNSNKSMQKLSSGMRINSAADDAAGLAISEKMRGQIRGLDQASANASDAISLIQTGEGALNETQSILQRMRELAVQSANDTNVSVDRSEIQKEVDQLSEELSRIGNTTEFNTQKLLNGKFSGTFQIGANESQNMKLSISDMRGFELGVAGNSKYTQEVTYTATSTTDLADGTYTVDGTDLKNADGNIVATATLTSGATTWTAAIGEGNDTITFAQTIDSGSITIKGGKATATSEFVNDGLQAGTYTLDYVSATESSLKDSNGKTVATSSDSTVFEALDGTTVLTLDAIATADMEIKVGGVDVSTQAAADSAVTTIQSAIENVSAERSKLGAVQNRLEHTINNLGTSSENLTSAESRIRDVDMAQEMSTFSKNNILAQAAQAMLAQANQQPQQVLQLLR